MTVVHDERDEWERAFAANDAGAPRAAPKRSRVVISSDLHALIDEAEAAVLACEPARPFVRGDVLVSVRGAMEKERGPASLRRSTGTPIAVPVSPANMRERLSIAAEWISVKKAGDKFVETPGFPPVSIVQPLLDRGTWSFPDLVGIVEGPAFLEDGGILATPGYHVASGLLYIPNASYPPVPARPTRDDALRALAELLIPFADFKFKEECDRSAALAAVLTLAARDAIREIVPGFAFGAHTPGEGKGLIADVVSIIGAGRAPARMSAQRPEDEIRKSILCLGLEAARVALLDNATGTLRSSNLANAMTAETWSDRYLGISRNITVSLGSLTWLLTGNNVSFSTDLRRRFVPIELDSGEEQPELRTGFKIANLRTWVREHRPRLRVAALTCLRAYHVAGRPAHGLAARGDYPAWDALVRGACLWLGLCDPLLGFERSRGADSNLDAITSALDAFEAVFGSNVVTAAVVAERCREDGGYDEETRVLHAQLRDAMFGLIAESADAERRTATRIDAASVGYALRTFRGRRSGGRWFDSPAGKVNGCTKWRIARDAKRAEARRCSCGAADIPPGSDVDLCESCRILRDEIAL